MTHTYRSLWERGLPDQAIAEICHCEISTVKSWRKRLNLTANQKNLRSKEELRQLLPPVGEQLTLTPSTDKDYSEIGPVPCRVIAVYPEKLCYMVQFDGPAHLRETFRVL